MFLYNYIIIYFHHYAEISMLTNTYTYLSMQDSKYVAIVSYFKHYKISIYQIPTLVGTYSLHFTDRRC